MPMKTMNDLIGYRLIYKHNKNCVWEITGTKTYAGGRNVFTCKVISGDGHNGECNVTDVDYFSRKVHNFFLVNSKKFEI